MKARIRALLEQARRHYSAEPERKYTRQAVRIVCEFDNPKVIARAGFWLKLWAKRNDTGRMSNPVSIQRRKRGEKIMRKIESLTA